jgi:hypothetical protein
MNLPDIPNAAFLAKHTHTHTHHERRSAAHAANETRYNQLLLHTKTQTHTRTLREGNQEPTTKKLSANDMWHNRSKRSQGNGLQTPHQAIQNNEIVMRLGPLKKTRHSDTHTVDATNRALQKAAWVY